MIPMPTLISQSHEMQKQANFQVLPLIFQNKLCNLQEAVEYLKFELSATNQLQFYVQPSEIWTG